MFAVCVWCWGNDVQPPSRRHRRKLQAPCGLRNRRNNSRPGRAYRLDSLAHIRIHENTIPSPTPPTSTNDHSETKWRPNKRTRSPPPRSSPRGRGRYRTTRRRPASTTLLRTSPSPRRYVRRYDSMEESCPDTSKKRRRVQAHCTSDRHDSLRREETIYMLQHACHGPSLT